MEQKKLLREKVNSATKSYIDKNKDNLKVVQNTIISHLKTIIPQEACIGGFISKEDEVNIASYFQENWSRWAFPKVSGEDLDFYSLVKETESFDLESLVRDKKLLLNHWNILEPFSENCFKSNLDQLDYCLIPGVAFDKFGNRMGRGKGYYDRALARYNGLKIGVCYSVQYTEEELPTETHDLKMDYIVTEKFIVKNIH